MSGTAASRSFPVALTLSTTTANPGHHARCPQIRYPSAEISTLAALGMAISDAAVT